ncbi:hypothetical protein ACHAXA_002904, partial [Cyclostephanos tholiformis]
SSNGALESVAPIEDEHEVARRHQDRRVCYILLILIIALITAMTAVATFAGLYVRRDEYANFVMQYNDSVVKVEYQFQYRLNLKRDSLMTFSSKITSQYGHIGSLQDVNRLQWEAYATADAWILGGNDSILIVPDPNTTWPDNRTVSFGIYSRDADNNVIIYDPGYEPHSKNYSDVFVPVWQIKPFEGNEREVMFNLHSEINRMQALDNMMMYAVPSLTAILQLEQDEDVTGPSSILFYPVLAAIDSAEVMGSVSLVFSWDTFFTMILPGYVKGMACVVHDSTGQMYKYTISGNDVKFMGKGDLDDTNYDDYKDDVEARLLFEGEDDGGKFITYTLVIYPSKEFEAQYITNEPVLDAVGILLIFLFTAGLFLLYDRLVDIRQQEICSESHGDSHTSSSVGGGTVTIRRSFSGSSSVRRNFKLKHIEKVMKGLTGTNQLYPHLCREQGVLDDEPIAELFHNTSIMFSDIVGFTKWSPERSPNEVFRLLEQIFWEFDEIAAKLNVFKLGTIGDCYIAVTGIPEPVQDHAVLDLARGEVALRVVRRYDQHCKQDGKHQPNEEDSSFRGDR